MLIQLTLLYNAPFYATYSDFFDAPLWTYSPNHYPLHYWQGHVYALYINRNDKTLHFTGGVNWGFKLSIPNIKPIALTPSNITIKQYKKDWSKFIQHFPQFSGYKTLYSESGVHTIYYSIDALKHKLN